MSDDVHSIAAPVQVTVRGAFDVAAMLAFSPTTTAFWMRDAVGRWFGKWRKEVANRAQGGMARLVKTQRGGRVKGGIFFHVTPSNRRIRKSGGRVVFSGQQIAAKIARDRGGEEALKAITGRFRTTSKVHVAHEFGAVVRATAGRFLQIPVNLNNPHAQALKANPDAFPTFRMPGTNVVFARLGSSKDGPNAIVPVYVWKESVTIPPRLGLLRTWDGLTGYRNRALNEALGKIVREMAKSGTPESTPGRVLADRPKAAPGA